MVLSTLTPYKSQCRATGLCWSGFLSGGFSFLVTPHSTLHTNHSCVVIMPGPIAGLLMKILQTSPAVLRVSFQVLVVARMILLVSSHLLLPSLYIPFPFLLLTAMLLRIIPCIYLHNFCSTLNSSVFSSLCYLHPSVGSTCLKSLRRDPLYQNMAVQDKKNPILPTSLYYGVLLF